jgi:hypothetical protein
MAGGEDFAGGAAAAGTEGLGVAAVTTVCFACFLGLLLDVTCGVKLRQPGSHGRPCAVHLAVLLRALY